jgi:predicted DNA-binding transcriptional regulator YafY
VIRESVYYLIATANDYQQPVQFALHRLAHAEVITEPVREPEDFSLDEYIRHGGFLYPEGRHITLVVRFDAYTAQHLIESPLSPQQSTHTLEDGRVEIRARVLNCQQLLWWLMGFGEKVEVMAPRLLRREVQRQYALLAARYAD